MLALIAGIMLWILVIGFSIAHIDMGNTSMVLLLALGAVLIASSSVESIKINLTGVELKTKNVQTSPIQITLPKIDYLGALAALLFASFIVLEVYASTLPPAPKIHDPNDLSYSNPFIDDPNSLQVRLSHLITWIFFLALGTAAVAGAARYFRKKRDTSASASAEK